MAKGSDNTLLMVAGAAALWYFYLRKPAAAAVAVPQVGGLGAAAGVPLPIVTPAQPAPILVTRGLPDTLPPPAPPVTSGGVRRTLPPIQVPPAPVIVNNQITLGPDDTLPVAPPGLQWYPFPQPAGTTYATFGLEPIGTEHQTPIDIMLLS
jgi:hypothetical protein